MSGKLLGRLSIQRAVSLNGVVGPAPLFGQLPDLRQVREPMDVQQPFSDLRVQAFDPGVLLWLTRFDEV